jgi:hypothetical protein
MTGYLIKKYNSVKYKTEKVFAVHPIRRFPTTFKTDLDAVKKIKVE